MLSTEQPALRPVIAPVTDAERPLISVMIPTYNCAKYVVETLQSVLAQDMGPERMQIEVVDDVSTKDDPEKVVAEIGAGRVTFFRQPGNVGATANFNTCVHRSRGRLVHILHGDDMVKPGFYETYARIFDERPDVGAIFCRQIFIDEEGRETQTLKLERETSGIFENAFDRLSVTNCIQPPSIMIRRDVYEALGGYDTRLFHAADWEMWVRIAAHYPIYYETAPLALYRVHSASDTSMLFKSGRNVQDRRRALRIFRQNLPAGQGRTLHRRGMKQTALYAVQTAARFRQKGEWQAALNQTKEALLCSRSAKVLYLALLKPMAEAAARLSSLAARSFKRALMFVMRKSRCDAALRPLIKICVKSMGYEIIRKEDYREWEKGHKAETSTRECKKE